jgi:hypothetical protein
VSGKGAGLDSLRQMLSARFSRSPRAAAAPPAPAEQPAAA